MSSEVSRKDIASGSEAARGPMKEERSVQKPHMGGFRDFWRCGRCLDMAGAIGGNIVLTEGMEHHPVGELSVIQSFIINEHLRSRQEQYVLLTRCGGSRRD